ncbi:MAG: ABC transporter substrate-binding protein, partial [Pseudomonadota bacterium]|nr:ABC transporter substrate-binding protein [Pseudomonadota bacterium]
DLPSVKLLVDKNKAWFRATDVETKRELWHEILTNHADNVYIIGLVNATKQPIVIHKKLRNIPDEGVYNWHPGAYFGIYRPATFWFATDGAGKK